MSADLERRMRALEDIEAIRRLKAEYCAACDDGYAADRLAALFTEDAVWDGGRLGKFEGREAIRGFFRAAPSRVSFAIHHVTNPLIDVDGDEAIGRWYLLQPLTAVDGNRALWLAARYHDRYVRTADGWKFRHVKLDLSFLTPLESGWAKQAFVEV